MIQPFPYFYAPEVRELSGDCYELQNAIAAVDLNQHSIGDAQYGFPARQELAFIL
jgi:hypothetical protein